VVNPLFRRELIAEFDSNPIGRHSPGLRALLDVMRGGPDVGRYVLYCTQPYAEWVLGRLTGDREDPIRLTNHVFHSLLDAERAVFRLRWKDHTGEDI